VCDALRGAVVPSQRPRTAQLASLTGRITRIPVESGAVVGIYAVHQTRLNGRRVARPTTFNVRVVVRHPRHTRFTTHIHRPQQGPSVNKEYLSQIQLIIIIIIIIIILL